MDTNQTHDCDSAAWQRLGKRVLDITIAGAVLAAVSPLLALAALAVLAEDGQPIFFRQERIGRHGRPFRIVKFRSMRVNDIAPDEMGQVRHDHHLVTRTGTLLRRLKIDELPQILNVLTGDMSLVGPRPTVQTQVAKYDSFERRRLAVPPGLSGWAQVNGNTEVSWVERIALDVWYIDHWSLWLDLKILVKTVSVVLFGEQPNPAALHEARLHAERARRSS